MTTPAEWTAFVLGNVPVVLLIGWVFFRSWGALVEAVVYMFTPDIISLFRGRLARDWWNEFKFGWFVMACLLIALLETVPMNWLAERLAK